MAVQAREPLETLSAAESDTLEAIVARLIPTDSNGPGAAEAARGALHRPRARWRPRVLAPDVRRPVSPRSNNMLARRKAHPSLRLSPTDQDAVLTDMESNVATGFTPNSCRLLRAGPESHHPGDVLRSLLRRKRKLRWLGSARLSWGAHRGHVETSSAWASNCAPNHKSAYDYDLFMKASARAWLAGRHEQWRLD